MSDSRTDTRDAADPVATADEGTDHKPSPAAAAGPSPAVSPVWAAARRVLRQPRFVVAAVVLAVAAVGLNAATEFLRLHFRKQAVPLRVPSLIDENAGIAAELGSDKSPAGRWVQVSHDEPMNPDVEHELNTKEHLDRYYFDTRAIARLSSMPSFAGKTPTKCLELVNQVRRQPPEDRKKFLGEVLQNAPDAIMKLHMAYYTGLVDTVAHIPDRCYVADGYEPSEYDTVAGPFGTYADGSPRNAEFRFIHFDDQTGQGRVSNYVGYLFHVNGGYESNPLQVRYKLQNLFEKFGYYAKVELMISVNPKEPLSKEKIAAAMKDFMTVALPDAERVLPDWQQVKAGK